MRIDTGKPLEELVGTNRGIVRQRLGNIHCMTHPIAAARICRPRNMRRAPVALRRGWALCVLETLHEYRSTYVAVTSGRGIAID